MTPEDFTKNTQEIYSQDIETSDRSFGVINWKDTEVCISLNCVCGHLGHFDGSGLRFWECLECGRKYALGEKVVLIELTGEQADFVKATDWHFETDSDGGDRT